jgi:hypothetical protein
MSPDFHFRSWQQHPEFYHSSLFFMVLERLMRAVRPSTTLLSLCVACHMHAAFAIETMKLYVLS